MRKLIVAVVAAAAVFAALTASALAQGGGTGGGVTGGGIYVDGTEYRTVGTPTDFSLTGAPDSSFDTIYAFPMGTQGINVATAAPGDQGYNGGRWKVHSLSFSDYALALATYDANSSGDFDSAAEVHAALDGGVGGAVDTGIVKYFECPVIPLPRGGH